MPTNPFVLIQERLADLLKTQGLEKLHNPITQLLKQGLHDLEFVSLEEFDAQRQVLERLQTQVKQLENRIAELESKR